MARTKATNMRVGAELHAASSEVFEALGIGMAAGINLFVNQCAIRGRMPFEVRAVEGMPVLKGSVDVPTVSFTLRTDPEASARGGGVRVNGPHHYGGSEPLLARGRAAARHSVRAEAINGPCIGGSRFVWQFK